MSRLRHVHWLAPSTMLFALLGGWCLALGHHWFYANLRGQLVPTGSYVFAGTKLRKQQFNTSVGTAFAFLVKTFLAVAISIAYVQLFWCTVKKMKQKPPLGELDWANAGLSNVFSLLYLKLWWKYPVLAILALGFWCVPIATVSTPATLSVEQAFAPRHEMHQVSQFDFTTMNYVASLEGLGLDGLNSRWAWEGPSQPVQHVALAVMGLGEILQIPSTPVNASWSLDFWGPALRCDDVADAKRDSIWKNIWNSYNGTNASYAYLSWVPWSAVEGEAYGLNFSEADFDHDLPFVEGQPLHRGPSPASLSTNGPASIFVAVLPASQNVTMNTYPDSPRNNTFFVWNRSNDSYWQYCDYRQVQSIYEPWPAITGCMSGNSTFMATIAYEDATLLRCNLVNTSYSMNFKYSNGAQQINVTQDMTDSAQVVHASNYFVGPTLDYSGLGTPDPVAEPSNCSPFHAGPKQGDTEAPCTFDTGAVRLLSYQGIMAAFNQLVLGAVSNTGFYVDLNTTVMRTILGQTEELGFLRNMKLVYSPAGGLDLKTVMLGSSGRFYQGLINPHLPTSRGQLKSALEELFQNYTVSLLAEKYLQPNYSSPFAPPRLTNVSIDTYETVYNYDPATLWIAYGLSISFTILAALAAFAALFLNEASYSDNFSTMLRISRTAEISTEVKEQDGSGKDPLPKYLKHARLNIAGSGAKAKSHALVNSTSEKQRLVSVSSHTP